MQSLPTRKNPRLKNHDYSQTGYYFITICTHAREKIFGEIEDAKIILNQFGKIAEQKWLELEQRFTGIKCGEFQIMPNHIHCIIETQDVGAGLAPACPDENITETTDEWAGAILILTAPRISQIIGAYKSLVALSCLKIFEKNNQNMGKIWQRNYYEHIIRNQEAYYEIANYIINNPANLVEDELH